MIIIPAHGGYVGTLELPGLSKIRLFAETRESVIEQLLALWGYAKKP